MISIVQRYKNQCKIEIFLEIKSMRLSRRKKNAATAAERQPAANHASAAVPAEICATSMAGATITVASAK